ncbi:hypothetical protein [Bacillus atrophaeus]|uniref:hypothetical protein n=1 Tax=Bacillus atrophaeus TaxID=1452 RepID=UPI0012DAB2D9|nr:hypothetical protein [Bacillus atrophaeus]MED4806327.1 hypothetical protein [Bacillus atrophaeus]
MAGQKQKRRLKKGFNHAGSRPAFALRKCDRGFTGAFLLLLIFRARSLVKK